MPCISVTRIVRELFGTTHQPSPPPPPPPQPQITIIHQTVHHPAQPQVDPSSDSAMLTYPPIDTHSHTVIFLHGRGDKARNFASSVTWSTTSAGRSLVASYPSFRWVFPTAPVIPCVALGGEPMSQWFDAETLVDPAEREDLQLEGLHTSVTLLRDVILDEARRLNWQWDRIVLMGISQGAVICVQTLLNLVSQSLPEDAPRPTRLGAVLGFSTWMALPGRSSIAETRAALGLGDAGVSSDDEVVMNTPILLEHCVDDHVINVQLGHQLRDTLQAFGADVTWKQYLAGRHWFHSPTGMDDAVTFIADKLGVAASTS